MSNSDENYHRRMVNSSRKVFHNYKKIKYLTKGKEKF
jgi:hypothetical protein